jgi:hypothetical protein
LAILRLLYLVDDLGVDDDLILVDGYSDVTPPLRNAIAAQNGVLFGASNGYNIECVSYLALQPCSYVTFGETQDELNEASHAAQIHVHNNGIRPSGG